MSQTVSIVDFEELRKFFFFEKVPLFSVSPFTQNAESKQSGKAAKEEEYSPKTKAWAAEQRKYYEEVDKFELQMEYLVDHTDEGSYYEASPQFSQETVTPTTEPMPEEPADVNEVFDSPQLAPASVPKKKVVGRKKQAGKKATKKKTVAPPPPTPTPLQAADLNQSVMTDLNQSAMDDSVMMNAADFDALFRKMQEMDVSVRLSVAEARKLSVADARKMSLLLGEDEEIGLLEAFK